MAQVREKWIIDTDPGCDDMMAILYLMNQPNVDILIIGTIDGNVPLKNTTNNMKKIMKWSGKSIPIHQGSPYPILKIYENIESYHYCDGLGEIDEIMKFDATDVKIEKENSALKYVELIMKYPGEINFLLIGPLTNFATAYMLNPDISNLVKNIYIMGGSLHSRGNQNCTGEFNFAYDFVAAKIVMSNFKNIILTPWEPTEIIYFRDGQMQRVRDALSVENICINEHIHYHSNLIIRKYSERMNGIQFCDLYCVMSYFSPSCVKSFFTGQIDINIDSKEMFGSMYIKNKKKILMDYIGFKNSEEFKKSCENHHIMIEQFSESRVVKEFEKIFIQKYDC
jgi:inosine-uridine nucleoside N-ribohydrolase